MGGGASICGPPSQRRKTAARLIGHEGGINAMCLTDDGQYLVTGSEDGTCCVWETEMNCLQTRMDGHAQYVICIAANSECVVTGSADKTIRKWNLQSGRCDTVFTGHCSVINGILLHENILFSTSYDKTARKWDLLTGECLQVYQGHLRGVSPLLLFNLTRYNRRRTSHIKPKQRCNNSMIQSAVSTQHSLLLITGSADNTARAWSMDSPSAMVVYQGHGSVVQCLAVGKGDQELYTGSADGTARSWDVLTGQARRVFDGHQGAVVCLKVSHF